MVSMVSRNRLSSRVIGRLSWIGLSVGVVWVSILKVRLIVSIVMVSGRVRVSVLWNICSRKVGVVLRNVLILGSLVLIGMVL